MVDWKFYIDSPLSVSLNICGGSLTEGCGDGDGGAARPGDSWGDGDGAGDGYIAGYGIGFGSGDGTGCGCGWGDGWSASEW